jgi:hypothetical protein
VLQGQLVVSLGGGHDGQVVFVSLFSVANAAGEVLHHAASSSCLQLHPKTLHETACKDSTREDL